MRRAWILGATLLGVAAAVPGAVAQSACGGLLQPACPPPPQQPPPTTSTPAPISPAPAGPTSVRVTIDAPKVHDATTDDGRYTTVSGTVGGGKAVKMELLSTSKAYGRSFRVVTFKANGSGRLGVTVTRQTSARYRWRVADGQSVTGQSPEITIGYRPFTTYFTGRSTYGVHKGENNFGMRIDSPRTLPFAGGPVSVTPGSARRIYFYTGSSASRRVTLVGTAKMRSYRRGATAYRYGEVWVKAPKFPSRVFACYQGTAFKGAAAAPVKGCGGKRITEPPPGPA